MASDLVSRIVASVERTYAAGTARFRWRMPADGPWQGVSVGAVDFRAGRVALRTWFAVPGSGDGEPASPTDGAPVNPATTHEDATRVVETHSVVADGILYTLHGDEASAAPDHWIAIELGVDGLAATPPGLVAWLRGVTAAEATEPAGARTHGSGSAATVVLSLPLAIDRAPAAERAALRRALESGRVGLSNATVAAEVVIDPAGRLTRLRATVPAGPSPWFAVAHGADTVRLDLHRFGEPVAIPRPDAAQRVSVAEFLSAVEVTPDATGWTPGPWPRWPDGARPD